LVSRQARRKDEFGDNPEYLAAKIQYWSQEGIIGLESIVRHHMTFARNNSDNLHLSKSYEYWELNPNYAGYHGFPYLGGEVPESEQVFDELHAVEDDYDPLPIKLWRG
jgi:hypothetical protein